MLKLHRTCLCILFVVLFCLVGFQNAWNCLAQSKGTPPSNAAVPKPSALDKLDRDRMPASDRSLLPRDTVAVIPGGAGRVVSCAFSSDGKLATGCDNGAIGLWDLTGKVPREITEIEVGKKTARVDQVVFSSDGKRLAAVYEKTLHLWNVGDDGAKPFASPALGRAHAVAFHPNNKLLICGANNIGHFFEINQSGLKALPHSLEGASGGYTFSPDGAFFASTVFDPERNGQRYGSEATVWKVTGNKSSEYAFVQQKRTIKSIALSPDGKLLATGSLDDRVQVWDLTGETPRVKTTLVVPTWIRTLNVTPNGRHLIAFSSGADIFVWNLATGEPDMELKFQPKGSFASGGGARIISASAMAPDGRHVAFSNYNTRAIVLRLFEPASSAPRVRAADVLEQIRLEGHRKSVNRVAFLPDGKTALSCSSDETARRWDLATGKQTAEHDVGQVHDIAVLPSGRQALFAHGQGVDGGRVTLWDYGKGRPIVTWKGHEMGVTRVRLLPDGKRAVTASSDGIAILWDIESGKQLREFVAWQQGQGDGLRPGLPRQGSNVAIAVSPDGKFLATGASRNKSVGVWRIQTGTQARAWPSDHGEVNSVAYSPDGQWLLTATSNHPNAGVQLWEAATGKQIREWLLGNTWDACFSPDGKRFLTADSDGLVRLMDVDKQIPRRIFRGHEGRVNHVVFSADGSTALSTGNDQTIRQWRIPD